MSDKLPENKTCFDCVHFEKTCMWLVGIDNSNTHCDWYPSKFQEIETTRLDATKADS